MGRRSRKSKRRMNSLFMALLLTAVMLIMSTYAWFSANRTVEINSITAKVTAAEGLQISLDAKTWGTSVSVTQANLTGLESINNYLLPDELKPVSTTGVASGDEILFYDGKVNADGTVLSDAGSATRSATTTANSGKYIVFDVYLKNASSRETPGDQLLLGNNSLVRLGTTTGKEGVENTGLENSVRIGFLLFDGTAAFTAAPSDVAAVSAGNALTSIWEPNYDKHITEVSDYDARIKTVEGTTTGSATFKTLGLYNPSGTLTGINGTSETAFMKETATVRTAATVAADTPLTSAVAVGTGENEKAAGTQLYLKPNVISKLRVYIWLEGQDPDCIDTASTGKYLDFIINLAKPAIT